MADKRNSLQVKADSIFNKKYKLKSKNDIYSLPEINAMFSTPAFAIEPLVAIKNQLNETKNLLNSKDIEKWRRHTSKTNPCGLVVKHLREAIKPELCTQAWAKFYEILTSCDIIPSECLENKQLTTFHLCEAPGAFIASLNHYIKSNFIEIQWKWLASTLNPFYEGNDTKRMISGERFIIETLSEWNFGDSYDGDLMQWKNLECLVQAARPAGKADIVTADGSISCADDPEMQEILVSQLLYCEVVASLVNLACGGSFVVKMFTMFEHYTVGILFLLCCFFEEVEVIKPGTSKPGNSEVYCACKGFAGAEYLSQDLLDKLQSHYVSTAPQTALFPQDFLPKKFLESLIGCAKTFSEYQTNAIHENIKLFENSSKGKWKFLTKLRKYLAEDYIYRFNIQHLKQRFFVVPHLYLDGTQLSYWPESLHETYCNSGTHHTGSYEDRLAISKQGWHERVVFLQHDDCSVATKEKLVDDILNSVVSVKWLKGPQVLKSEAQDWSVELGKPIDLVRSSRFCSATLIAQVNEARENANILNTVEGKQLIGNLERLVQEKTKEFHRASSYCNIVSILRECGLLKKETRPVFVDITGNGRFVSQLLENGVCYTKQCVATLCQNCQAHCDGTSLEFEKVLVKSCSSYDATEVERLEKFGREKFNEAVSVKIEQEMKDGDKFSTDRHLGFGDTKLLEKYDAFYTCSERREKVKQSQPTTVVKDLTPPKPRSTIDGATCETTPQPDFRPFRVVLGSIFNQCQPIENHDGELSSKVSFVNQCLSTLLSLKDDDSFVCEISDTLTQFTVGVIYILHLLFKQISLISPAFCPTSKQFLVCRGFITSNEARILTSHLKKILEVLKRGSSNKDIIGVIPIEELFSEKFYKHIRTQTTNHVAAQLDCIVKCERLLSTKNV